jgi:hypothetical protein
MHPEVDAMFSRVVSLGLGFVLLLGCSRRAPVGPAIDVGGPSGTMTWHASPGNNPRIPGIDDGGAQYIGRMLVIWSSDTRGGGSSDSQGSGGITSKGGVTFTNGRQIFYECVTPDGKSGRVTIDGVNYELADGPLFLLAPDGDKCRVKQLKKDLSSLELKAEGFQAFGRNDPDILEFFTGKRPEK